MEIDLSQGLCAGLWSKIAIFLPICLCFVSPPSYERTTWLANYVSCYFGLPVTVVYVADQSFFKYV